MYSYIVSSVQDQDLGNMPVLKSCMDHRYRYTTRTNAGFTKDLSKRRD